jgi:hypothetical protein
MIKDGSKAEAKNVHLTTERKMDLPAAGTIMGRAPRVVNSDADMVGSPGAEADREHAEDLSKQGKDLDKRQA